ncbi:MAG: 16S rRNA (adenine(1518)-N(6)/adenine(1519)-N(6))-dimethyltransferase RsmA [Rhodospirillaceae bacterium]|nr:16S rRNA (adenine(1518)-N(6)/adenine(1519)-N(6))-dimethyltransferase RsmA [Rhodospirillaceae bacterium]
MSPDPASDAPTAVTLPPLREIIAQYGLGARRSLGQHFLFDLNLTRRIAREAGPLTGRTVVEIGPGPGGLTRSLLESDAKRIVAIERDARCIEALGILTAAYPERLEIVEADALTVNPAAAAGTDEPCIIVANLPYNIGTRLLIDWLRDLAGIQSMTLMFQKEVADRILAPPGASGFGRLSVITQWLCDVRRLFDIPAQAFVPPPKVQSTVIQLTPRQEPLAPAEFKDVEAITAAAFGQRRKMLRSALRSLDVDALPLLEAAGIRPDLRAETLSVEEFCALARALKAARAAKAISL